LKQTEYLDKNLALLLQTWEDNKNLFDKKPKEAIEKDIKDLHKKENQICSDPKEGEWICYYMAKKLVGNTNNINSICEKIPKQLELLNQLDPCCICLDEFEDKDEMEVLECCHKICNECFKHWVEVLKMQHKQIFCPLCRREMFHQQMFDYGNTNNIII